VFEPLPDVTAAEIKELLEYLEVYGGQAAVSQIAADMHREMGQVANAAKAAELLDFVTTPDGLVVLNNEGSRFVRAGTAERKGLWSERLLLLRLFRTTQEMLRRAGGPIDSDFVVEAIILNLPEENYEKMFATFINWARYGELFGFDETAHQISMQGIGHDVFTFADRPPASAVGPPALPPRERPPAR
jgi:NitT/TauT family transport system ATP-binding protein